jgi:hypothetical protein
MLAQVSQTFWAKKNLVKSLLIFTLDKVIYNIGTFLQGSTKPRFTTQNRLEISCKKIRPFFQHARSRSKISILRFLYCRRSFYAKFDFLSQAGYNTPKRVKYTKLPQELELLLP